MSHDVTAPAFTDSVKYSLTISCLTCNLQNLQISPHHTIRHRREELLHLFCFALIKDPNSEIPTLQPPLDRSGRCLARCGLHWTVRPKRYAVYSSGWTQPIYTVPVVLDLARARLFCFTGRHLVCAMNSLLPQKEISGAS